MSFLDSEGGGLGSCSVLWPGHFAGVVLPGELDLGHRGHVVRRAAEAGRRRRRGGSRGTIGGYST